MALQILIERGLGMKKIWWIINAILLSAFGILSIIIMTRTVDGTGTIQTPTLKWINFLILAIFFVFLLVVQIVVLFFIKKNEKKS